MRHIKFFVVGVILSSAFLAMAKEEPNFHNLIDKLDFMYDEPRELTGASFLIVNHADSAFDKEKKTFPAVQKILGEARNHAVPTLGFVSDARPKVQAYDRQDVSYLLMTDGGQHRLSFPEANRFYFSGGNLSLCLCEAIRDTIKGSQSPVLDFYLVADAVYDSSEVWPASLKKNKGSVFTLRDLIQATQKNVEPLQTYLSDGVFGNGEIFCPNQTSYNFKQLTYAEINLKIVLKNQLLFKKGTGDRTVNLHLIDSSEIPWSPAR